jgi:hypothetical protein
MTGCIKTLAAECAVLETKSVPPLRMILEKGLEKLGKAPLFTPRQTSRVGHAVFDCMHEDGIGAFGGLEITNIHGVRAVKGETEKTSHKDVNFPRAVGIDCFYSSNAVSCSSL